MVALAFAVIGFLCLGEPAQANETGFELISGENIEIIGDFRIAAADGERSWVNDEFGKLRNGGTASRDIDIQPELGTATLLWQPRFSWSLSGTAVVRVQGGGMTEAGLSEAFLSFKPLGGGKVKISARAGLMIPPVSLEHSGADWGVTETITPSAINSWIGEEVMVAGIELTGKVRLGEHSLAATLAGFDFNDTAGALLAFRGWALHDRVALAFRRQPLPPHSPSWPDQLPRYSHPIIDTENGFLRRPGYVAKLAWDMPAPIHLEFLHYDNNGNPQAVDANREYGWRTKFDNIGLVADLAPDWELRVQALRGHTVMGLESTHEIAVDMRFRAAYAMVTRRLDHGSISARIDLFDTSNRGTILMRDDDEDGWALTAAARRNLGKNFEVLAELLHVKSTRGARSRIGISPQQTQNQSQISMRLHW